LKGLQYFYFSSNFDVILLLLNELYWELRQNVDGFPLSFTVSEINFTERDRKVQISKIVKVLIFIQFECSFCILKCYWWAIKMWYFITKRDTNFRNFAYLIAISSFYFLSNFDVFFVVEWIMLSVFGNMSTMPCVFYWATPPPFFIYWNPTLMGYIWTLDPM
jgi:hypothetical protein